MTAQAYSYIRFSTSEQIKGDSLRRQTELSRAFVAEKGLFLDESLTMHDLGISAFKGANAEQGVLSTFLKAIDEGRIPVGSYLLVESLDRLSRAEVSEALDLFLRIINQGITIVTLADRREYSKASVKANFTDLIVSIAVMARAHEESAMKSHRLSEAWKRKRELAVTEKKIISRNAPFWLSVNSDKSGFEMNEGYTSLVQEIFQLSAQGLGVHAMAKQFNERGTLTPKNRAWDRSSLGKILRSRAVIGEATFGTDKQTSAKVVIEDYFPKIVDAELFMQVQDRLNAFDLPTTGGKKADYRNLFRHLLTCPYCGSSFSIQTVPFNSKAGKKNYTSIFCVGKSKGNVCDSQRWDYFEFQNLFLNFVKELDLSALVTNKTNKESKEVRLQIANARLNKAKLEKKLENLIAVIEEGDVDIKSVSNRLKELQGQLVTSELQIEELERKLSRLDFDFRTSEESQDHIKLLIDLLNDPAHSPAPAVLPNEEQIQRRAKLSMLIAALVENIDVYSVGGNRADFRKEHRGMIITFKSGVTRYLMNDGTSLTMAEDETSRAWVQWNKNGQPQSPILFSKEKITLQS